MVGSAHGQASDPGEAWWAAIGPDGTQRVNIRCGTNFLDPSQIVVRANVPVVLAVSTEANLRAHNFTFNLPAAGAASADTPVGLAQREFRFSVGLPGRYALACRDTGHPNGSPPHGAKQGTLRVRALTLRRILGNVRRRLKAALVNGLEERAVRRAAGAVDRASRCVRRRSTIPSAFARGLRMARRNGLRRDDDRAGAASRLVYGPKIRGQQEVERVDFPALARYEFREARVCAASSSILLSDRLIVERADGVDPFALQLRGRASACARSSDRDRRIGPRAEDRLRSVPRRERSLQLLPLDCRTAGEAGVRRGRCPAAACQRRRRPNTHLPRGS